MVSIADYLKKLLYQYDCVVVPELGGFLTQHQPAHFELASSAIALRPNLMRSDVVESGVGRYMPPRKRLAFNEALRLDDGILLNYVMLHESLTRETAQHRISAFVSEVNDRIQRSGSYTLDGIGMLTQNAEGRFQFEPQLRQNFLGDAYGLPIIDVVAGAVQPSVQLTLAQPEKALSTSTDSANVGLVMMGVEEPDVEEVLAETDADIRPLGTSRSFWRWAAAAVLIGSVGTVGYLFGTDPGRFQEGSLSPANLLQIPASVSESVQAMWDKVNQPSVPVAVEPTKTTPATTPAGAPSVVALVLEPVVPVVVAKTVEKTEAKPVVITPERAAVVVEVKHTETKYVPTAHRVVHQANTHATLHYVIVAGSFANRTNAVNLRRTLRKAGYTDAYIIPPTEKGMLHKVAAFGTYNRDEIAEAAEKIAALTGTPGWVFSHR